ncbi:hypothetical protein DFE_3021 [Desulfovibrio ferrophilus]|uniref:Uncharacterized protein n=1 Tax=Desulfovibrio ferrophilus TaxID=241368 RepID=A0A2Z6B2K7_9BACT|nr:hypothetical protein DFE_3021 [Desulfovibrio ferrophilus]
MDADVVETAQDESQDAGQNIEDGGLDHARLSLVEWKIDLRHCDANFSAVRVCTVWVLDFADSDNPSEAQDKARRRQT